MSTFKKSNIALICELIPQINAKTKYLEEQSEYYFEEFETLFIF